VSEGPQKGQSLLRAGPSLGEAAGAMILVHGRGGSAAGILELSREFSRSDCAYLAPQASGGTWYPFSFLAPTAQNEPWLSSSLSLLDDLLAQIAESGVPVERTLLLGFSQGACLALEYAARAPRRLGGVELDGVDGGHAGLPRL
jgi:phospholipase/carboxylesterase